MKHNYKGRYGEALVKIKYWHPFGLHFFYHHQVDGYNNRQHFYISLESTSATNIGLGCNFKWYLAVKEMYTALASGHFQYDVNIMPILAFCMHLLIQCM